MIAETRIRYGCQRIHILLRREGWRINYKKTYRIDCQEGLNLRTKRPRRHITAVRRRGRPTATKIDQNFVANNLFNGRRIEALTIVDNFSQECLTIHAGQGLKGEDVVAVMHRLKETKRRVPQRIQTDNGSEFISKVMDRWAYENGVVIDFSKPGKPTDNPFIESFNSSLRDECLNGYWFLSLEDVQEKREQWWQKYNQFKLHSSLNNQTPEEFIRSLPKIPDL